jgi:hypothetical protein
MGVNVMVEEQKPTGRTETDLQAVWPSKCFDGISPVPEPHLKTPILHVLIYQEPFITTNTVAK